MCRDNRKAARQFARRLCTNMKPMPSDFTKTVDDNFWELI